MMNLNRTTKHVFTLLIFTAVIIGFIACGDDNSLEELRKNELAKLNEYMQANYPDAKPKRSGLYYIEEVKGTGDTIVPGDQVQIYYATWLIDNTLIDETNGYTSGYKFEPFTVNVGSGTSIAGLEEALTYMQKGTVAFLVINSELAYGQNGNIMGNPPVPGFTTLLMRVEVYKVYQANP
jgi:FKBP-type peptidyl-prolyl cis-trans isomerase FkpA